jgi:Skp family chaperone for outer membrane proteins
MEPIMMRVEQVIGEVRQAEGFAIVFDVASEAIISADPALDLTNMVITRLRAAPAAAR